MHKQHFSLSWIDEYGHNTPHIVERSSPPPLNSKQQENKQMLVYITTYLFLLIVVFPISPSFFNNNTFRKMLITFKQAKKEKGVCEGERERKKQIISVPNDQLAMPRQFQDCSPSFIFHFSWDRARENSTLQILKSVGRSAP